ncbi:peptidoglycan DD-metalloendopeptidase family protein [Jeotgalibacillus proteolyticus]|uniref:peptidoglycan DD-metalloendopeptidase family protein n=1 Tax=Jeotgalibacillus proteolyticus TaxID=2082395 RepID=UPI00142FF3D7|nr:M23 family metallopeptidase [Jeotgalibacillus proteolyticus]
MFQVIIGAATMLSILVGGTVLADTKAKNDLSTLYHVYSGDQYVGAVSEEESVKGWVDAQKDKLTEEFELTSLLSLKDEIVTIPEQVFNPSTNDDGVLKELQASAAFQTEAKTLKLNGQTAAHVAGEKEAKEALRLIKESAIPKEELDQYEKQDSSSLPDLKVDETRITEIEVEGFEEPKEEAVSPDKLVSPEKAAKIMLKGLKSETVHKASEEDTVEKIIEKYDMDQEEFEQLNPSLTDGELKPGSEVAVTVQKEGVKVHVKKETRVKESIDFKEEVVEDDTMPIGETSVKQKGKEGERVLTLQTEETDGKETAKKTADAEISKMPVNEVIIEGTKEIPSKGAGSFIWPANGGKISSHQGPRWGSFHKGIDIAGADDLTIKAADNGTVISAAYEGDYGNKVVIDHNNGLRTTYAHLDKIHVTPGQTVKQGESLGVMGNTGFSTGVHLHFEVHLNGELENPMDYL